MASKIKIDLRRFSDLSLLDSCLTFAAYEQTVAPAARLLWPRVHVTVAAVLTGVLSEIVRRRRDGGGAEVALEIPSDLSASDTERLFDLVNSLISGYRERQRDISKELQPFLAETINFLNALGLVFSPVASQMN